MKKILQSLFSILFLLTVNNSSAQILFSEDFDYIPGPGAGGAGTYVFAPGWLLRNVDNRTPFATVAYVNEAWERREDFQVNVLDSVAFSTSYYAPVGPADDWMWTPLIGPLPVNAMLSWNARTYDPLYQDGYEVRIMVAPLVPTGGTGVIGNQVTSSTVLFSIPGEQSTWINRQVNLNAYAGQSVRIAFRNNSNDKFLLVIDDVKVEVIAQYDAHLIQVSTPTEYSLIPKTQVTPLPLQASIQNNGVNPITNVALRVDVLDASMTQIFTSTGPTAASMAPGVNATFNAGPWTPPNTPGVYTLKFYPVMTQTDDGSANDTITRTIEITDTVYARDMGAVIGSLGIGGGGFLGNEFTIYAPARLASVSTYFNQGYQGEPMAAVIWNKSGGFPNSIIAYTDTLFYPDDSADTYTMPMHGGDFLLAAGDYVITQVEFDSTLSIGLTNAIFTTDKTWVDYPGNPFIPWANNEDFGATFTKTYTIRANLLPACPPDILTGISSTNADCGLTNGSATAQTTGAGPFTYNWSTGGTTATETGLDTGMYIVTVIDDYSYCSETDTVTIINPPSPSIDSTTVTEPLCFGNSNGSASVFVSGGTPGYFYSWSSGGTGTTEFNLATGNYTVTITDDANCETQTVVVVDQPTQVSSSATGTDASCFSCTDGMAVVTSLGGAGNYTYSWAPSGGNNDTASALPIGIYTVTVTDENGCTSTSTVTIQSPAGIKDEIGLYATTIYPNPSNGTFTINGDIQYNGDVRLEITNVLGEAIWDKTITIDQHFNTTIQLKAQPGSYLLRLTAGKYQSTKTLIIQ